MKIQTVLLCFLVSMGLSSCSVDSITDSVMNTSFGRAANKDAMATAIEQNNVVKVKELIASGANVNATDSKGNTALMIAARQVGSQDVMRALINGGANVNMRNKAGQTALGIAKSSNNQKGVNILKSVSAQE